MSSIRDQLAKWHEGLRAGVLLIGGGAALGAVLALLLPVLPGGLQERSLSALPWLPGLYRSLSVTPERPEGRAVLLLEASGREVAVFPGPGGSEVDALSIATVTATWGALLGLLVLLLWRSKGSRQVLGLSLVLGLLFGLALAATLPAFPSQWAPFWLRGLGGLPGLEESLGSGVPLVTAEPSSAQLRSTGGLVAEYPPGRPPWDAEAEVEITPRGRAWLAALCALGCLAVLSWAQGLRVERERARWPLFAFGLALLCWLVLPFLPAAVGDSWMSLVSGGEPVSEVRLGGSLLVLERTRLGHDIGFGLLAVLFAGACVVLLPIGMLVAAGHALARRFGTPRSRGGGRAVEKHEPIPVEGLGDEPDWLEDYEERRSGEAEPDEPHPSPGGD